MFEIAILVDSRANSDGCIVGKMKLFRLESDNAGVLLTVVILFVVIVTDDDDFLVWNIL